VVLRGRDYVHAAIRSVGLGKVVFTSFPINALDESQPQATALWEQLLGVREHAWAWNAVELGATRRDVLGSMIGRKVAPWGVAAGLAGGYLLVILAVQLAFRGASRPRAFAWSGAVAVLLTCVLLVMGMTRRHEQSLLAARLTVMDVAPDGGGWQHESVTFIGADDPGMPLRTTDEQATIRPALADVRNPPEIRQAPMTVNKAGVLVDRIDRVWEASGPVGSHVRLKATARFNADGMSLHVDNGLGQPLRAPVLVSQLRALAMADLPVGQTLVKTMQPNAHDDFSNTLVLTSELSKRRGQVVLAALTPSAVQEMIELPAGPPMLIGFIDDAAGAGLIRVADDRAIETRVMTMVRTTVAMEPPAARTKITVPAPLVSIAFGKMPYDRLKEATEPSQQDGQWLIGFAVPRELGRLRPTRAKLQLRADVPGHRVTIRKEQCVTGIATVNEAPDPIATWERSTGLRDVSIDLSDHDIDREGRVWLLLDVHSTTATASASPLAWQIKDVAMSLEGEIIAPPTLVALPPTTNSVAGYTAEGYVRFQPREVRHMTDSEKQRLKDELAASLSKARPSSRAAQPQSTTATSN
jgi:hypothetical protein